MRSEQIDEAQAPEIGTCVRHYVDRDPYVQDLFLSYFGEERCVPGHNWGPAVKDHFKIHIVFEGEGTFESKGIVYHLDRGQAFLICPGKIASYRADEERPWHYGWFGFNGIGVPHFLEAVGFAESVPVISVPRIDELLKRIREMEGIGSTGQRRSLELTGLLYRCIALLADSRALERRPRESLRESYVRSVLEHIEANYSSDLTVEGIAQHIGLQRSYLTKLFSRQMGCNIQQYLIGYRIRVAIALLSDTSLSIGDIARSVGYDDSFLFSKNFHRFTGRSPRDYRRGP